jgi:PIN domain nuclease of toxin-antitoxin system
LSVFDSSAILAVAFDERGGDVALDRLFGASAIVERLLLDADVAIDPFEPGDARVVGELDAATRRHGLSRGDRACLALALRLDLPVVIADRTWAKVEGLPVAFDFIR